MRQLTPTSTLPYSGGGHTVWKDWPTVARLVNGGCWTGPER
jgi:hypothetical protein